MTNRTSTTITSTTIATLAVTLLASPVLAGGDSEKLHALEQRVEALTSRIANLEQRHRFVSFMPNYAERFHVMHWAGEAEDWAVASHELEEMKRLTALATAADPEQGKLMQQMMAANLEELAGAIEHGDHEKFETALNRTIVTCNACHAATGSDFIQVTLDTRNALSLRHPHRLMARDVPGEHHHHHGVPQGQGAMMAPQPEREVDHDHKGDPEHKE